MKINLEPLSNHDLARLIREASALLAQRLDESPQIIREPAPRPVIHVAEPSEADKDFCLYIKGVLMDGGYIKADERRRVAGIAEEYPQWVRMQGLPTRSNTAPWRGAQQYHGQRRPREV